MFGQVGQPIDFIHPQPVVVCPPSPFPSPHPSNQVAALPSPLIAAARVAAAQSPAVPVPSSGQGPTAAMTMNPHFNGIVVSPWPGFYPGPDGPVMVGETTTLLMFTLESASVLLL